MTVPRINTKVKDKVAVNCSFIILHKRSLTNFVWSRPFDKSKNCNWATNFENKQNKIKKSAGTDPILLLFKHQVDVYKRSCFVCQKKNAKEQATSKIWKNLDDWRIDWRYPNCHLQSYCISSSAAESRYSMGASQWFLTGTRVICNKQGILSAAYLQTKPPMKQVERGWKFGCGNQWTSIPRTIY